MINALRDSNKCLWRGGEKVDGENEEYRALFFLHLSLWLYDALWLSEIAKIIKKAQSRKIPTNIQKAMNLLLASDVN